MTNQMLYHVAARGIEFDLLPWCQARSVPVMAYCPLAQAGTLRRNLFSHAVIMRMAHKYQATPAQIMLAWVLRQPSVIAIPKASSVAYVEENARALTLELDSGDIAALDVAFPAPTSKQSLDVVSRDRAVKHYVLAPPASLRAAISDLSKQTRFADQRFTLITVVKRAGAAGVATNG